MISEHSLIFQKGFNDVSNCIFYGFHWIKDTLISLTATPPPLSSSQILNQVQHEKHDDCKTFIGNSWPTFMVLVIIVS